VGNADRGITGTRYGHNEIRSALEIFSAKEAKRRFDCCGKHLGCSGMQVIPEAGEGLQYGLSGNRATEQIQFIGFYGNTPNADLMGNRLHGNGRYPRGKSGPT